MEKLETAVVAGGCFWCVEAVFERVAGVESVENGYSGGQVANPSYEQVCSGTSGHAEAVRIRFDAAVLPYGDLLDIFLGTHDPTQADGQGNDRGPQYRSAIFPLTEAQRLEAEAAIARAQQAHSRPVVTAIEPAAIFYPAEAGHQGYYRRVGARNPYCTYVIDPKVRKLQQKYGSRLKEGI